MPNGGSDCCSTCCFIEGEFGKERLKEISSKGHVHCTIRALRIDNPFWTYCANHPFHNPKRIEVPVGPVYVTDDYPYSRRVKVKSPDTEEIRLGLIKLLLEMQERPFDDYPTQMKLDEGIIVQLMEFREKRAVQGLRKIIHFNPLAAPRGKNPHNRRRVGAVAIALEALGAIEGDCALDELERGIRRGLDEDVVAPTESVGPLKRILNWWRRGKSQDDEEDGDPMARIRYHAVLGLKHCGSARANDLLRGATHDPHPEVAAFARKILAEREAGGND